MIDLWNCFSIALENENIFYQFSFASLQQIIPETKPETIILNLLINIIVCIKVAF